VSLHFQLELNRLRILSVPTEKSKGLRSREVGDCTSKKKCLRTDIGMKFLPCFGVGNLILKFFQVSKIHPAKRNIF
jgi:hypothetical protein